MRFQQPTAIDGSADLPKLRAHDSKRLLHSAVTHLSLGRGGLRGGRSGGWSRGGNSRRLHRCGRRSLHLGLLILAGRAGLSQGRGSGLLLHSDEGLSRGRLRQQRQFHS